ncbi:MAG: phosphatidate cytidylyltransferase [Candidatus Aminicenantes bacterium]|nr:phosphatidate cytidylyltransferase [Candidatus Aminicenantes bacterium]
MSLRKRLPTSIVLLAFAFCLVQFVPPLWFLLIMLLLILVSLLEFYSLFRVKRIFPQKIFGIVLALLITASFYFEEFSLALALYLCLLLAAVYYVVSIRTLEKLATFPQSIALTFFGAIYLSFTLNHFYLLKVEKGPSAIFFLLAVISMGDTGAYFFGSLWGRRKLAPIASPKKTWEGAIGGIVFAVIGAVVIHFILLKDIALWMAILTGVIVHVVAQFSDPLESLFKRAAGVKDSSNVLPGHGGFLDRLDSLILATPFFYYFVGFFW